MNDVTGTDLLRLFILALPVAAISWTFTHEDLFRDLHSSFVRRSQKSSALVTRKFFYLLTCEYCFSHYVAAATLVATGFTLLYNDWRGWLIAWLALVWVANHFISLYGRLKLGLRSERLEISLKEAVSKQAGISKVESSKDRKAG